MNAYDIVLHDGHRVDRITDAALKEVERRLGYELTILQGSYNAGGVGASSGTHDGGGAVDLAPWDWQNKVHAMRAVGFAAWHRPAIHGLWVEHIHCILIGNAKLSPSAAQQVEQYRNHRDGLAGQGPDNTWHPSPIPVFHWVPTRHTRGENFDKALWHLSKTRAPKGSHRAKMLAEAKQILRAVPTQATNKPPAHDPAHHLNRRPSRGRSVDAALDHITAGLRAHNGPVRTKALKDAQKALLSIRPF